MRVHTLRKLSTMFTLIEDNVSVPELWRLFGYRVTYSHLMITLRQMEDKGLLRLKKVGRSNYIKLTERGKAIQNEMRGLIETLDKHGIEHD
ncbi:MAG: hypothetical protein ACE5H1_02415 [Thermodesulfobacteriota bacterium]